jgi:hypothetical protein
MTEYTSLEVSKRLAGAGFDAVPNALWDATGGENDEPIIVSFPRWKDDKDLCRAYRSDTILMWLIERGWDISIGRPRDKVLIDAASMKANVRFAVEGDTLPDALAEVILKVLEVSK